jgi:hypothetical protein
MTIRQCRSTFVLGTGAVTLALIASFTTQAQSQSSEPPVIAKLVGRWKEDQSKRKLGGSFANLRFRQTANGLEELRGPDVKPLVQPVKFDGKPYEVDDSKNTIVWKQMDANHFERQIFQDGKLISTRRIQISADGKALTQVTEQMLTNGKQGVQTVVFQRSSGGPQGLAGIWKPQSAKTNIALTFRFERAGSNSLKFTSDTGQTYTLPFDNTPVTVQGPAVITGSMRAAGILDDHTIELTSSRQGAVSGKSVFSISSDGKVLTETATAIGPEGNREPSVRIFEKQ